MDSRLECSVEDFDSIGGEEENALEVCKLTTEGGLGPEWRQSRPPEMKAGLGRRRNIAQDHMISSTRATSQG
jgi:hypothetical protein